MGKTDPIQTEPEALEGADEIASFLAEQLGPKWTPRRVYDVAARRLWPIWHEPGVGLMARRSTLLEYIAEREKSATKPMDTSPD